MRSSNAIDSEKLRGQFSAGTDWIRIDTAAFSATLRRDLKKMERRMIISIVTTMVGMFLGMAAFFITMTSYMLRTTEYIVEAHMAIHAELPAPQHPAPSR